jgi:beta-glucosidase/6-phospho-beta-glucosidase/beta-galactosidase
MTAGFPESFFMGGFESSSMKFHDGRRVHIARTTRHIERAAEDYALLADLGVLTVREALAWHDIEREAGKYDWRDFLALQRAAERRGIQIVWDLCHYGWPDHLPFWSDLFLHRFAHFCGEAARVFREESDRIPVWVPVNEISYWSYAAGDCNVIAPGNERSAHDIKRQLVRAAIVAINAVRRIDGQARIVHAEPIIHIVPRHEEEAHAAESYRTAMFEAWDMLAGRMAPELGGREDCLDVIGVNYYPRNQWFHRAEPIYPDHPLYRPVPDLFEEVWRRYRKPLIIAETGSEAEYGAYWLGHVCEATREAQARGVPIEGICLYPVMDYPGWGDDRHCRCGLIACDPDWRRRRLDATLVGALRKAQAATGRLPDANAVPA